MTLDSVFADAIGRVLVPELERRLVPLIESAVGRALSAKQEPLVPLATLLGCSIGAARARLHRMKAAGVSIESLGGVRVGKQWRFRASDVSKWIAK